MSSDCDLSHARAPRNPRLVANNLLFVLRSQTGWSVRYNFCLIFVYGIFLSIINKWPMTLSKGFDKRIKLSWFTDLRVISAKRWLSSQLDGKESIEYVHCSGRKEEVFNRVSEWGGKGGGEHVWWTSKMFWISTTEQSRLEWSGTAVSTCTVPPVKSSDWTWWIRFAFLHSWLPHFRMLSENNEFLSHENPKKMKTCGSFHEFWKLEERTSSFVITLFTNIRETYVAMPNAIYVTTSHRA